MIGHSRSIAAEAGIAIGLTSLVVGLQSVCNGLGRIAIGALFDRCGSTTAMLVDAGFFSLSCLLMLIALKTTLPVLAFAGLLLIGFSYGGMPTLTSSVTADCFGSKHYGSNFSVANMSMLPASFGATIVGAIQTGSGTYASAFILFLVDAAAIILLDIIFRQVSTKLKTK